jgi:hypothetical protein
VFVALMVVLGIGWMVSGPLRPGWNALANSGQGSGARIALAQGSGAAQISTNAITHPFSALFQGTASQSTFGGSVTVNIGTTLDEGMQGALTIMLQGQPSADGGLSIDGTHVTLSPSGNSESYQGQVTAISGNHLSVSCIGSKGDRVRLDILLRLDNSGSVTGTVQGSPE